MQLFTPCVHAHTHVIVHMYRSEQLAEATFPFCHVGPGTKAGRLGLGAAPRPLHHVFILKQVITKLSSQTCIVSVAQISLGFAVLLPLPLG